MSQSHRQLMLAMSNPPFNCVRKGSSHRECVFGHALTSAGLRVGVLCGAAASGHFQWTPTDVAKSLTCMLMSGPLLTGYTQTINDYYDKDIDAINEPNRPIPSGIATNQIMFR